MGDRRRINGLASGTCIPIFSSPIAEARNVQRTRKPNQLRKICALSESTCLQVLIFFDIDLQTGLVSGASGSAYLELENPQGPSQSIGALTSSLKLSCTIHGPKPLPRNAAFSSNLQLAVNVKFAPFATSQRRGYIRDATERDIATHLETALNGVVIANRWPKSAIDIVITILEAEDDNERDTRTQRQRAMDDVGNMNIVCGCITVASAGLLDAQIDCLDLITGGVAALVTRDDEKAVKILDPSPYEEPSLTSACVVGYLPTRDEITLIWAKGDIPSKKDGGIRGFDSLLDGAVNAAKGAHVVLRQVARELGQAQTTRFASDDTKT